MATILYKASVRIGERKNKDGETKGRYVSVGVLMQNDDGRQFLLLDRTFNPAGVPPDEKGGNSVLVSLYPYSEEYERKGSEELAF